MLLVHSATPATPATSALIDHTRVLVRCAKSAGVEKHHPVALYLASVQEQTRPPTAGRLRTVARFFGHTIASCPWLSLRFEHLIELREWALRSYSPTYGNQLLLAVSRVFHFGHRAGLVDLETARAATDVPPIKGYRARPGREIPRAELQRLVEVLGPGQKGWKLTRFRDAAALALFSAGGLRRREAVNLDLDDLDTGGVNVRRGKGNKDRRVDLSESALATIAHWVNVRGTRPGPLVLPLVGTKIVHRRLSPATLYASVRRLAQLAGLGKISPHDFRRTLTGDLLDLGVDLVTVAVILGHESIQTTKGYDRRPARRAREASQLVVFPQLRVQ